MRFAVGDLVEYDLCDYPDGTGHIGLVCSASVDYHQQLNILWASEYNSYFDDYVIPWSPYIKLIQRCE